MGTKANPGKFDCYAAAKEDEPVFVLLGHDPEAAETIRYWAQLRAQRRPESERAKQALQIADDFDAYRGSLIEGGK